RSTLNPGWTPTIKPLQHLPADSAQLVSSMRLRKRRPGAAAGSVLRHRNRREREIRLMDKTALQALQAPLKDRYRSDPDTACITLRSEGRLGEVSGSCSLETGPPIVDVGYATATGGVG